MTLLAYVATIRHSFFLAKLKPENNENQKILEEGIQQFNDWVSKYFEHFPKQQDNKTIWDQAAEILKHIRFNYW